MASVAAAAEGRELDVAAAQDHMTHSASVKTQGSTAGSPRVQKGVTRLSNQDSVSSHLLAELRSAWGELGSRSPRGAPGGGDGDHPRERKRTLKGVFFHQFGDHSGDHEGQDPQQAAHQVRGRTGDFMQRLQLMLASEEATKDITLQLYNRFEGDPVRLERLLEAMEDRWGFPERVFPLLRNQLSKAQGRRRAIGSQEELGNKRITEEEWVKAFRCWLQVLSRKCADVRVERQVFVQTHASQDLWSLYLEGVVLGKGSYGEVRKVLHPALGVARVVKSVPKAQIGVNEDQVEDEVNTLKSLDHPHIVRIFEAFEDSESLHMVMDYAEGGDLASVIKIMQARDERLPEDWSRAVAKQVASALAYMHSEGVIHCDLKPGNTMLLRKFSLGEASEIFPHVLLADFGLAEIFDGEEAAGGKPAVKGTPAYLAPEGFEGRLTCKSDVWALGVMVFEMLTNERPFRGSTNVFMLFCQVANTHPPLDRLPQLAQDFVREVMQKDPDDRPQASQLLIFQWFLDQQRRLTAGLSKTFDLETLGHASYFQRAVMFCMAVGLGANNAPGQDMDGIFHAFKLMDEDESGTLTVDELKKGLKLLGIQQNAEALMSILDMNQDHCVSYTEFLAAALRLEGEVSERLLRYAFSLIDRDQDGQISMSELRQLLAGGGTSLTLDVLPDGKTVDEVMEEVSQKQGSISYQQFRDYVCKQNQSDVVELTHHRSIFAAGSGSDLDDDDLGAAQHYRSGHIQSLVADLDNELMTMGSSEASSTENDSAFPLFHAWLDQIMEDSGEGADFGHGLTYADQRIESLYIGHNMETTSSHMCMLMTASFCYSVWNMCQSGFRWDPTIVVWDNKVRIAYNLAWMFLAVFSVCVFLVCWRWTRMEKRLKAMKPSVRNEDARDREAVRLERRLCACFCLVPWVGFLFAQRFRVATLFGEDPDDIFSSRNSDYDLIITIIALLMFISTRTRIRWCCCCLMAASSCLSYCVTALLLGFAESCKDGSSQRGDPAWPGVVLVVVCILNLCGHYSVEYQRRVVFLSFYASYEVLRESFEEDHTAGESFQQVSKEPVKTSVAQINRSLSLVKKLSNSSDLFSKPMRNALKTMVEALQNSKQEVVQADVLKIVDVMEILDKVNVWGKTRDQLLTQFDSLPTKLQSPEDGGPSSSSRTAPFSGGLLASPAEAHPEAWGWDTISRLPGQGFAPQLEQADLAARPGRGSMTDRPARPLLVAAEQTLLPAVADMVESADDARQLAQKLLAGLQRCYDRAPRGAESRAALALHAGHWLCRRLGVWRQLEPFERVAFAVAAAGLHTGAGGTGGRGGALGVGDPLLRVAASLARTLSALDESGLVEAATGVAGQAASASMSSSRNSVDRSAGDLRHLVRQLLARQQPRVVLADVRRVHCSLQSDLLLWSDEAQRTATMALVLAAGDLAFLALPRALHLPWVALMRHEVSGELDVTACLRGLGEALALPVFRTLGALGSGDIGDAMQCLEANSKVLKFKHQDSKVQGGEPPRPTAEAALPGSVPYDSSPSSPLPDILLQSGSAKETKGKNGFGVRRSQTAGPTVRFS